MIRALFLVFLFLFGFVAKAQVDLSQYTFPEQLRFIDSLRKNARKKNISAAVQMQPYIKQAIENRDEELETLIQSSIITDKLKTEEIDSEQYLLELDILTAKCKKNNWNEVLALLYLAYAGFYQNNQYNAIKYGKYQLLAYRLYSQYDVTYFTRRIWNTKKLGEYYYHFGDFKNAVKYLKEAGSLKDYFDPSIYNSLGLSYYLKNDIDSALYYFDSAYRYSVINDRQRWQVLVSGNMIEAYIRTKNYDSAISIGKNIIKITKSGDPVHCRIQAAVGYVYLLKNDAATADKYYQNALECFHIKDTNWHFQYLEDAATLYQEYADVKGKLGQYKKAYKYAIIGARTKDTLAEKMNFVELKRIEDKLEEEKLDNAKKINALEKGKIKLQRNLLIAVTFAAVLIIFFVIYRYRTHREKLERERNIAAAELLSSKDKLATFTKSIQEKNKLIESFEQKLSEYKPSAETIEYTNHISELRQATILTDDEWEDFRVTFEKVHIGFLFRLKKEYPKLTPAEVRYIVLLKLQMNTKEMASVLGVNSNSIRTTKSRLIKKLTIENEQELDVIVNSI